MVAAAAVAVVAAFVIGKSLSARRKTRIRRFFFFVSFRFVPFYGAFFRVFYLFRVSSDARVCGVRCNYQRTNAVYN